MHEEDFKIVGEEDAASFLQSPMFTSLRDCNEHCTRASRIPLPSYRKSLRNSFKDGEISFVAMMVARSNNRVVASCQVMTDPWNTYIIESVCVRSDHRGAGLCKKLISSVCTHLLDTAGARRVRIYTYTNLPAACACYKSVFGDPVNITPIFHAFEMTRQRKNVR